jgi:hypothetical protein
MGVGAALATGGSAASGETCPGGVGAGGAGVGGVAGIDTRGDALVLDSDWAGCRNPSTSPTKPTAHALPTISVTTRAADVALGFASCTVSTEGAAPLRLSSTKSSGL